MIRINDLVLDLIDKTMDADTEYSASKAGGVVSFVRNRFKKDGTPKSPVVLLEIPTSEIRSIKDDCDTIKNTITAFLASI